MAVGKGSIGRVSKAVEKKIISEVETVKVEAVAEPKKKTTTTRRKSPVKSKVEAVVVESDKTVNKNGICKVGDELPVYYL
ncbi:MAG: hypothetical protein R3Y24_05095 [Eubacteriales bacterium]